MFRIVMLNQTYSFINCH